MKSISQYTGKWPFRTGLRPAGLTTLLLLGLTGCASTGPELSLAAAAMPREEAWSLRAPAQGATNASSRLTQPSLSTETVPVQWWSLFDDPLLSALQALAVTANLDLQTALVRIAESQARLGLTQASGQPILNLDAGHTRAGLSADSPFSKLGIPTKPYDQWQWGLQASWELDLWGHHERLSDAARAQLEATHWALGAARVTLAADVARNYFLLRGVQAQQSLLVDHRLIATELLRLTESRERNGVATQFDSAAARADLATVRARAVQLGQQRDALMNGLALLLGQAPHDLDERLLTQIGARPNPVKLPVGVPSDLVRQRPDILQAQALLRAATADKGAAQADFYPRVSLNAGWSLLTSHIGDISNWDMRQFSVGPVVHLPIFHGGRLQRTLVLTEARQRAAAIHWRQVVLKAWHEVTSSLDSCAAEQTRSEQLEQAVNFNNEALNGARDAWKAGSAEFTTVLVAQRSLLNAQAALVESTTARSLAVVSLYRALGSGADMTPDRLALTAPGKVAGPEVNP